MSIAAGVPTYVIYPAGSDSSAHVLPELLTRDIVSKAIDKDVLAGTEASSKYLVRMMLQEGIRCLGGRHLRDGKRIFLLREGMLYAGFFPCCKDSLVRDKPLA